MQGNMLNVRDQILIGGFPHSPKDIFERFTKLQTYIMGYKMIVWLYHHLKRTQLLWFSMKIYNTQTDERIKDFQWSTVE